VPQHESLRCSTEDPSVCHALCTRHGAGRRTGRAPAGEAEKGPDGAGVIGSEEMSSVKGLNKIGLSCHLPEGAFYAFPSVEKSCFRITNSLRGCLPKEHVAVVPGVSLGGARGPLPVCLRSNREKNLEEALTGSSVHAPYLIHNTLPLFQSRRFISIPPLYVMVG